jgi:hypothetical protein
MKSLFPIVILCGFLLTGCVTMSPQAELVQVVYNPLELNPSCTSLGVVEGWDGFWRNGPGYENVERAMREYTAMLGGNVLLPLYARGSSLSGVTSRGQAYRCP